jgi:hypothetical protein
MTSKQPTAACLLVILLLLTGCSDDGHPLGFTSVEDEINDARPIAVVRVINWQGGGTRVFERPEDFTEAFAHDGQLVIGKRIGTEERIDYVFNLQRTESVEINLTGVKLTF